MGVVFSIIIFAMIKGLTKHNRLCGFLPELWDKGRLLFRCAQYVDIVQFTPFKLEYTSILASTLKATSILL